MFLEHFSSQVRGNEEIGATYPHHHSQFDFDEQAMLIGGKLLLSLVNSYVRDEKESFHHVEGKK